MAHADKRRISEVLMGIVADAADALHP